VNAIRHKFNYAPLFVLGTLAIACVSWRACADEKTPAARSGEGIYQVYCSSCHGGGWQGAPIAYDEAEWKPRLAKGFDAVMATVKKGLNSMPPKGACMDCSDEELTAAIKEMLRY
jgi:cytochrome c5